ncbi:FtsX-like permease family protein [Cohnella sp. CFH 77786]|uniref:ABC transporter permease n=1 Tax=Cohnella sp. CFH 77786 TaxID=2662265 RepID=UPI001C60B576|nr:ABC transporter permease [Cohnella sp. CFH 77786]MBW5448652.1 FtsX-like permease family protein [Cohnella sp. CFH 77786]
MKGYGFLAGRYLKQQRRRSILTVLGILMSVALISALGTMGQALKDNVLLQQIDENGSFHFGYSKPAPDLYRKLEDSALIDKVGAVRTGAGTPLGPNDTVFVQEVNEDALEIMPIHLASGSLPGSPDEVAAEEWIVPRLPGKPKLGDEVTLTAPNGKPHAYRLVGILRNDRSSQISRSAKAVTLMADADPARSEDASGHVQLFATFKKGVDISSRLAEFAKLGDPFITNGRVLALMGESQDNGLNRTLNVIFGTLVGLVVLSTIAVIYNAFHISVLERIRQFGLLRTIGATPRQIRNLVLREATMLALIGIPLGLAIGWGGLWLTLWLMIQGGFRILQMDDFRLTFHWWIMGLSVGVSIASIYLAAWLPARKASRVSPVEATKGAGSIVRESYRRLRIPSLLGLLGVEGRMAANNIRRNRTKFRITTFSIVISVMLFIVFHYFTQQAFDMTVDRTENDKIAFTIAQTIVKVRSEDGKTPADRVSDIVSPGTMDRIAKLPGVDAAYGRYEMPSSTAIVPESVVNPDFSRKMKFHFTEVNFQGTQAQQISAVLQLYDEARLAKAEQWLESGTADPAELAAEDGVLIVQTVKPYNPDSKKRELLPLTRYKVGDRLTLQFGESASEPSTARQVKIAGILSQSPFDSAYQPDALYVIGTKSTMAKLLQAVPAEKRPMGTALMGVDVALKDGADAQPVREVLEQIAADIPGGQLINVVDRQKEERQFAVQMKIFVYGFLAIIGLIGSLNIVNTVQTNLLLRRREFGLLQAVGMTMGQIRKMATAEGVWFGVIGGFWGLLLGTALSWFLFSQLSRVQGIPFDFPWSGAAIASAYALGVGLLSVQGPLRRMAKANLIEELREDA